MQIDMKESQQIEFKQTWRDEYLKWICGFANAEGGKILIGVNDDGTICGVSDAKRLIEDIPKRIHKRIQTNNNPSDKRGRTNGQRICTHNWKLYK